MLRRTWHQAMQDVANGKDAKGVIRQADGILDVDTFHGHVKASELKVGPENMSSSTEGRGLIRDQNGALVFA